MSELAYFLDILAQTGADDPNHFNGYLILGYVAMWLVVMVYLISLWTRERNAREELKTLEQLLREDERPPEP